MDELKAFFFNDEAKNAFEVMQHELEGATGQIDRELLVTFCNLRSQKIELEKEVKQNGYTAVNENSRGGKTYQIHPSYRAYISCVSELTKIRNRLVKVLPDKLDEDDEFDNF